MLLGVGWMFVTVSAIIMALRIYCKLIGSRRLWWDDYVLIASWVSRCLYGSSDVLWLD